MKISTRPSMEIGSPAGQRRTLRNERKKSTQAEMGEDQSNKHSSGRQKQAFNKQLLEPMRERAAPSAERTAISRTRPRSADTSKRLGDIGARDQKKKAD